MKKSFKKFNSAFPDFVSGAKFLTSCIRDELSFLSYNVSFQLAGYYCIISVFPVDHKNFISGSVFDRVFSLASTFRDKLGIPSCTIEVVNGLPCIFIRFHYGCC